MRFIGTLGFAALILSSILLAALIWAAGDILAMFAIAFILAYLFNPLAEWMCRHGLTRTWAAVIITGGLIVLVGGAMAVIGPVAYSQLQEVLRGLQSTFTETIAHIRRELAPYSPALRQIGLGGLVRTPDQAGDLSGPITTVVSGGIAFAGTVGLALLAPVVTFYLLKDWPRMMARVMKDVPPDKRPVVRRLARKVDDVLSAFLHGQARVCLAVAVLYSIGLTLAGLQYGAVLGIMAGALKFLPYVGTAIAFVITLMTGFTQPGWDGLLVAGIVLTFAVTEIIESSILSPRIIGNRVQLAPALVIFAVLLGGKLLGVIGVFIAIPAVAVGRVLITFWLHREKEVRTSKRRKPATRHEDSDQKVVVVHTAKR